MTTTSNPADTGRQTLIAGLRDLADYLAEHPEVPGATTELHLCVPGDDDRAGLANLSAIADLLGVAVTDMSGQLPTGETTHFYARRSFGPVTYKAVYITRARMADHHALTTYSDNVRADRAA